MSICSSAQSSSRSADRSTPVNDRYPSSSISKKKAKKTSKSGKKQDPGNCFCKSKKGVCARVCVRVWRRGSRGLCIPIYRQTGKCNIK